MSPSQAPHQKIDPQIVFEDPSVLVISKPAGLLSQGDSSGAPHLVEWLQKYLGRPYVGLVHRLDRNTSGLMVVAKRTKSANRLTQSLQAGKLNRRYVAILECIRLQNPELRFPDQVTWDHWLKKNPETNISRVIELSPAEPPPPGAQHARLKAGTLATSQHSGKTLTLAWFRLETGRGHQIRVQSAKEGFSILGDKKYGSSESFPQLALHSFQLEFPHPISQELLQFEMKPPQAFFGFTWNWTEKSESQGVPEKIKSACGRVQSMLPLDAL